MLSLYIFDFFHQTVKNNIELCLDAKLWKKRQSLSTYKEDMPDEPEDRFQRGPRTRQVTRRKDIGPNDPEVREILRDCISYEAFLDAVLGSDWEHPE